MRKHALFPLSESITRMRKHVMFPLSQHGLLSERGNSACVRMSFCGIHMFCGWILDVWSWGLPVCLA